MPRITYHDRFRDLLDKNYLSSRDRSFVESLYAHYKRRGSLTAGRRTWFCKLEAQYATKPTPAKGASEMDELIARVQKVNGDSWDFKFVTSIQAQLNSGRTLSPSQSQILGGIQTKYSESAMQEFATWEADWNEDKAERYRIAMTYYRRAGYFSRQVADWESDKNSIPPKVAYEKVVNNKYAKKVLDGWFAAPKYSIGSMVAFSSMAGYSARRSSALGLAVVIQANSSVPSSAGAGNKMYKVLPVGSPSTVEVSEKELKRAPKKKAKK